MASRAGDGRPGGAVEGGRAGHARDRADAVAPCFSSKEDTGWRRSDENGGVEDCSQPEAIAKAPRPASRDGGHESGGHGNRADPIAPLLRYIQDSVFGVEHGSAGEEEGCCSPEPIRPSRASTSREGGHSRGRHIDVPNAVIPRVSVWHEERAARVPNDARRPGKLGIRADSICGPGDSAPN